MKKKSIASPVIFMFGLSFILVLILAYLNQATAGIIEENAKVERNKKILYAMGFKESEIPDGENLKKIFDEKIEKIDWNGSDVYLYKNGDKSVYAVPFEGPGLWGSINGYIGISEDLKKIEGVEFTKQDETPGLGGRISEPQYKDQYRGLDLNKEAPYVINRPQTGGNIDAIAGASLTSGFVTTMINEDLSSFIKWVGDRK